MKYAILFEDDDEFAHKRPQFMADRFAQVDPYPGVDPGLCQRPEDDLKPAVILSVQSPIQMKLAR